MVDNTASRRVAEKLGATLECIARNRLMAWGRPHDAAVYSLTTADLQRLRPQRERAGRARSQNSVSMPTRIPGSVLQL